MQDITLNKMNKGTVVEELEKMNLDRLENNVGCGAICKSYVNKNMLRLCKENSTKFISSEVSKEYSNLSTSSK